MIKAFWREMGRDDFCDEEIEKAVAVLPIAAIEQHGPHLPTGTDAILAEGYISHVVAKKPQDLPLVFLPVQQVGWSEEHLNGAGTLTSSWKHLLPYWTDLCLSVRRVGIKRLVVINSHGGNGPLQDILMQDLRVHHGMVASATNWLRFGYPEGLFKEDEIAYGIHGGAVETSLMLALRPDLVAMDKASNFTSQQEVISTSNQHLQFYGRKPLGWMATDLNEDGVVGNASSASVEKGQKLIDHIAEGFTQYAREVSEFPLPGS
ncbi:creatininase family protein [uncultured Cohaesibacter sp.]|uniref:creatininase family protein n=1 Tax=uncultured Cohaesibacter sp. TaxID=1002546 RepID=UPI00292E9EDF|nr:creatininase family protein [uncultured Cohaesibacter sp.]